MSSKGYDESIESIDRRIEQLRARRRDEVARHERSERRAESAACMAYGRAVIAWAGGDWKAIDPEAFGQLLDKLGAYAGRVTRDEPPTTSDALRGLRAWESSREPDGGEGDDPEASES
jgi:hypothetical protein